MTHSMLQQAGYVTTLFLATHIVAQFPVLSSLHGDMHTKIPWKTNEDSAPSWAEQLAVTVTNT